MLLLLLRVGLGWERRMKAAKQVLRDSGPLDDCQGKKLQEWPSKTA